jgi:hypothetical protein
MRTWVQSPSTIKKFWTIKLCSWYEIPKDLITYLHRLCKITHISGPAQNGNFKSKFPTKVKSQLGLLVHAYNPSTWEAELKDSLGYIARPFFKKTKTKAKQNKTKNRERERVKFNPGTLLCWRRLRSLW